MQQKVYVTHRTGYSSAKIHLNLRYLRAFKTAPFLSGGSAGGLKNQRFKDGRIKNEAFSDHSTG
jgi:hypothetical protein